MHTPSPRCRPARFPMPFSLAWKRWRPLATGHMYPETFYGHLIAMLEIMVGMFGLAVITGLIFVRFSRPTARIHFSKVAVIAPFDGVRNLMIRVANLRHEAMLHRFNFAIFSKASHATNGKPEGRGTRTLPPSTFRPLLVGSSRVAVSFFGPPQ